MENVPFFVYKKLLRTQSRATWLKKTFLLDGTHYDKTTK